MMLNLPSVLKFRALLLWVLCGLVLATGIIADEDNPPTDPPADTGELSPEDFTEEYCKTIIRTGCLTACKNREYVWSCDNGGCDDNSENSTALKNCDLETRPVSDGSVIDNLSFNYIHRARDADYSQSSSGCGPCGAGGGSSSLFDLKIDRLHRSRDAHWRGSLGYGTFIEQLDTQVHFVELDGGAMQAEFYNPHELWPLRFTDGVGNDARDGLFKDTRNGSIKRAELLDVNGNRVPFLGAAFFEVERHDGHIMRFELISMSTPFEHTSGDIDLMLAGRLVSNLDRNGYGYRLTYQPSGIDPDAQWRVNTMTDAHGRVATFTYKADPVGGAYVVERIDLPNGESVHYEYSGQQLWKVTLQDGAISTFGYGFDVETGMVIWQIDDAAAKGTHRRKKAYLTPTLVVFAESNANKSAFSQSSQAIRMLVNGVGEVAYLNFEDPNTKNMNISAIYEGGNRLQSIDGEWKQPFYEANWRLGVVGGKTVINGAYESSYASMSSSKTQQKFSSGVAKKGRYARMISRQGKHRLFDYDGQSFVKKITFDDGTVQKWSYNQFKQVTRYEDRLGRVTKYGYDSRGNMTRREVGIVNTKVYGAATPDPSQKADEKVKIANGYLRDEYAIYRYRYYPAGHESQFLLQTEYDANYPGTDGSFNGDAHATHRKDYVYGKADGDTRTGAGTSTYLIEVIEGKDFDSDSSRAKSTYTYDAAGRLATSTDPMSRVASYHYDQRDRQVQVQYNDGSTERVAYGTGTALTDANLVLHRQDRNGFVTSYEYDDHGRKVKTIYASHRVVESEVIDSALTDLAALLDTDNDVEDDNVRIEETCTYLKGSNVRKTCTRAGELTEYTHDYRNRVVAQTTHPRVGTSLTTRTTYKDNQLFKSTDAYGRDSYNFYRASDRSLVRTVRSAVPDFELADFEAVGSLQRELSLEDQSAGNITAGNSRFVVTDYLLDAGGQQVATIDPRGIVNETEFDSRGRAVIIVQAAGQSKGAYNAPVAALASTGFIAETDPKIAAKSETIFDANSNVIETRSPRYFDSSDTEAFEKSNTQMEYTGRNLLAARIVAAGSGTEADEDATVGGATELLPRAKEKFTYYPDRRAKTREDYRGNIWETLWHACCGRLQGQIDPEGHGTISNTDYYGNVTHTATVNDLDSFASTDSNDLRVVSTAHNPDGDSTLNETTTRYDERNRPIATTVWLKPQGLIDPNNVPIAGGPAPGTDPAVIDGSGDVVGLTTYYHYFESVNGDTGSFEVSLRNGPQAGQTISLADVITEMNADGIDLNLLETVNGYATVTENPEGELSVSISDGNGRNVISAQVAVGAKATKTVTVDANGLATETVLAAGDVITWRTMHYDTVAAVTTGRFEGSTNSHTLKTLSRDSFDKESASYSDGLGRTIESEDELGNLSFSIYDNNGSPRKVRDANGVGQDCDLDFRGRDILCKDTAGDVTKTVYDANSNVINIEDGKAQVLAADTVYDARDRVIAQTTRLSVDDVTKFTYDKNSNQREIADADALKAATSGGGDFATSAKTIYSYDTRNLKISTAYPGHNSSSAVGASDYDLTMCTYDAAMRKLVQTDQKGDTQAHLYDMANRLTERQYRTYAQSGTIGTGGIPTGSIASDIENNAQADFDTFEYDLASRATKAKKGRYINEVAYTYDDGGRMVDETITVNTTAGAGKSYSMLHDFDTDSRMTRCTYPDGSKKTSFFTDRDEVDKTFYQGSLVSDFDHDAGYRESSRTFGNNLVTTKTYNSDNTYSSITVAGKTGLSFDYTYDDNKNVLTETTGNPMAGFSWSATYDAKDRLKTWARTNTVDSQSWDLSEVGDWKNSTDNGVTTARGHNAVHEIGTVGASTLTHDAKGNTTTDELGRVLNWDFENKLQSADASAAGGASSIDFTYDAVGRRITKGATLYAYCGQKVCAEYDVGALAANPERKFIYGTYVDEPLMLIDADGAGSDVDEYYYHCNRQYSVTGLTDDTGAVVERYAYTPYGQTTILAANGTTVRTTSSYDNPYMYTGRRIDLEFSDDPETAMYYFRARYYSPTLGRFIGRDPLGYVDGYSLYAGYFASMWGLDSTGLWKHLGDDIWCAVSGDTLKSLAGKAQYGGDQENWSCLWPVEGTKDNGYPKIQAGDKYDASNLKSGLRDNELYATIAIDKDDLYGSLYKRSRHDKQVLKRRGEQVHRLLRSRSGEGRNPITYFEFAAHGRFDSSRGGAPGLAGRGTWKPHKDPSYQPAFDRAKLRKGPRRCWFARTSQNHFVTCNGATVARGFADAYLRKGSSVKSTNNGTETFVSSKWAIVKWRFEVVNYNGGKREVVWNSTWSLTIDHFLSRSGWVTHQAR